MSQRKTRTVRELGGEIWSELTMDKLAVKEEVNHPLAKLDVKSEEMLLDIIMGVLARHCDSVIVNDEGLPVSPKPHRGF